MTRSIGSIGGVSSRVAQSIIEMTTTNTTSAYVGPLQSIGQGGDQPLEKNVLITPTYRGGSLPDIGKFGRRKETRIRRN